MPKQVSAGLMFGTILSIPVPDVDRSDHLLILGANPLSSNGSLLTAPDMRGRIRRLRERGGKVVVVDPRRSRTAEAADEHHCPPRHGRAPAAGDRRHAGGGGTRLAGRARRALQRPRRVRELVREFPPGGGAGVRDRAGGDPPHGKGGRRRGARGRLRHRHDDQEFGTLASWLVDVLNVLTGNLDREGGAIFTLARRRRRTPAGSPAWARASGWAAGTAACAGFPRPTASCPWPAWPRRSIRRARARSGR